MCTFDGLTHIYWEPGGDTSLRRSLLPACTRSLFSWPGHLDEDEKEGRDHRPEGGWEKVGLRVERDKGDGGRREEPMVIHKRDFSITKYHVQNPEYFHSKGFYSYWQLCFVLYAKGSIGY